MFLKVTPSNISFGEYLFEGNLFTKPLVLLIAVFVKLFRLPLPVSTDVPAVQCLDGFRVGAESIDEESFSKIEAADGSLQRLGFDLIDYFRINDIQHETQYGGAFYRSGDGITSCWVRHRMNPNIDRGERYTRIGLYSIGSDGKVVLTTSSTRDLLYPPDWSVRFFVRCDPGKLLEHHRVHVTETLGTVKPMPATDGEAAFDLIEHCHEEFVAFQIDRNVFSVVDPDTVEAESEDGADLEEPSPAGPPDELAAIVEAVRKHETKQSQWLTKLIILGGSIAFFVTLGALRWELELVLLLVPILFVHELGHYAAMRIFGYKNVHMFFIPLLGAAVSGRHYRVAGWKKALVSLAGPLPSIVLGLALGGAAAFYGNDLCYKAAILTLILNVFNLLPFFPLDGGWVAHVTLFSRSNMLDFVFRAVTIGMLLLVAVLVGDKLLIGLGVVMALGLSAVWKTLKATELVRQQPLAEPEADQMPEEAIRVVHEALRQANFPAQGASGTAKTILSVYENVVAKPPSWPATLGIWVLYLGGAVTGVIGMVAITMASFGADEMFDVEMPEYEINHQVVPLADGQFQLAEDDVARFDLLAWELGDKASAEAVFDSQQQNGGSVSRLGTLVFTSREAQEPDAALFDLEFREQMEAMERIAVTDPRLAEVSDSIWQRAFLIGGVSRLEVLVVSDAPTISRLLTKIESVPGAIEAHFPIAPWTPRLSLSDEQAQLQQTLALLQGRVSEVPWEESDVFQPMHLDEMAPENLRNLTQQMANVHQQNRINRMNWIREQAESADGARKQLLDAYVEFEDQQKAWRNQTADDEGNPRPLPRLPEFLLPMLDDLGYLSPEHPLYATTARVEAYEITDKDGAQLEEEGFPLDTAGKSLLIINIDATHDAAAAVACVHAWLKQDGLSELVWRFQSVVLPE